MNDDFRAPSGAVEGTAVAFADSWKLGKDCYSVAVADPCSQNTDKRMMKHRLHQPKSTMPFTGHEIS